MSPLDTLGLVTTHFNKALRMFNAHVHRLSVEAKVSCCIVFTVLTIYMHHVGVVSSHVSAALHFLREHEAEEGLRDPVLKDVLAPIIRRLTIDACTFSDGMNAYRTRDQNPYQDFMFEVLKVPATFDTCQDAYESLCIMLKYSIAMSVGYIKHNSRAHVLLQGSLRRFHIVLSESTIESCADKRLSNGEVEFYREDFMLHHRVARLIMSFQPDLLESSYDLFASDFQAILDQMKELIGVELDDPWRITLCWIPPLFLIATKCRTSTLRREALRLMHSLHRAERGWTSCIAYALAKFVIDQEEPTWPHDRATTYFDYMRLLSVSFNHDEQIATITYLVQRDQTTIGTFSAELPMKPLGITVVGAPEMNLPDSILKAFGYIGTIMCSPSVKCHCHTSSEPVSHQGKVTESGEKEVAIWQAGVATSKVVRNNGEEPNAEIDRTGTQAERGLYDDENLANTQDQNCRNGTARSTVPLLAERFPVPGD